MKRIALLFLAAVLCSGFVVGQDANKDDHMKSDTKMMTANGTVTKVDEAAKMMTIRVSKGKEMMISRNDSTKVNDKMMAHSVKASDKM